MNSRRWARQGFIFIRKGSGEMKTAVNSLKLVEVSNFNICISRDHERYGIRLGAVLSKDVGNRCQCPSLIMPLGDGILATQPHLLTP